VRQGEEEKVNVLVTGAFGNVGLSTVDELLAQGHQVRCFDLGTRANRRAARRYRRRLDVAWGDLRRPEDVAGAVRGQEAVIHLAFIVPKLSSTGFECEEHPDWAREINVGGTRHLLEAMQAQPRPPRLLFASSCAVYGRTQHLEPPRTPSDPLEPIDHYARHKVECEQMVRASGLEWAILRLGATLPLTLRADPGLFDVPLDNRIEYVHTRDVALALANAVSRPDVSGQVLLIGGGPRCQHTYGQLACSILDGLGVGMLPARAFSSVPYVTDWLDTAESQRLLRYQRHTLDDYVHDLAASLGVRRHLVRLFRPVVHYVLLKQSAHFRTGRSGWIVAALHGLKALKGRPPRLSVR
jgi:UDP-glucose 4-epimerase